MTSPWKNKLMSQVSLKHIDENFLPKTQEQIDFLCEEMLIEKGNNILDLGCGAGRHAIPLAEKACQVTGIDISEHLLEAANVRASQAGVKVNFIQEDLANLGKLNLGKNTFDGAICLNEAGVGVLGNLNKELKFYSEIYTLLKDDSKLVISCFNGLRRYLESKDNNPKFNFLKGEFTWSAEISPGESLKETQRLYIPSELTMLLTLAGFKNIEIFSCKGGVFSRNTLGIDEFEMLVIAHKGKKSDA